MPSRTTQAPLVTQHLEISTLSTKSRLLTPAPGMLKISDSPPPTTFLFYGVKSQLCTPNYCFTVSPGLFPKQLKPMTHIVMLARLQVACSQVLQKYPHGCPDTSERKIPPYLQIYDRWSSPPSSRQTLLHSNSGNLTFS